ncbi:MAG: UbiD family decarboxylase [Rhodospirillaceae bacterium]|nr:UbiD family decarboxylase [Rhodospirillaceae bacterium]
MNKDLRTFIGEARQLGPAYFANVSKQVDPVFEPCVIQQKLAAEGRYPVIRCNDIKGSRLPLATNMFGSYELLGLALGVDPGQPKGEILKRFIEREQNPLPTQTIDAKDAPVKQKVITGDDIDLGELPIVHHAEKDSGKYITVGVLVVRDPDSGVLNAGMYRHEVQGKDLLGCMFNPAHHGGYIYRRYKELNKRMEAVLFIGHHLGMLVHIGQSL